MANMAQAVAVNGSLSSFKTASTGVPQGSVLGPLLFFIFINDLPSSLCRTLSNIYADDTVISACGSSIEQVKSDLQTDVDNIVQWFSDNKLTVSISKTNCMLSTTDRRITNGDIEFDISINGTNLVRIKSIKYIGLYIDATFPWAEDISKLCCKIASKIVK